MSSSSTHYSNTNHDSQTIAHSSISVQVLRLSERHTHSSAPPADGERKRRREVADIPWLCPSVLTGTQRQQQTESTSPTTTQRYPDHHHHQMGCSNPDGQITITMANQKSSERHLRRSAARQEIVRVLKLIAVEDTDEVRRESARVLLQMLTANAG